MSCARRAGAKAVDVGAGHVFEVAAGHDAIRELVTTGSRSPGLPRRFCRASGRYGSPDMLVGGQVTPPSSIPYHGRS